MATRDALSLLPGFKWREVEYPVTTCRYSFRHEQAEHRVSYGGITLYEPLGPQNPTFEYTLPMDQGIAIGPYSDLFKKVPSLAEAMLDRTPGPLVDPVYGTFTCVPVSYQSDVESTKRSGALVSASFVWAPDLDTDVPRTGGVDSIADMASDAAALDAEVERIARTYDRAARPPQINPLDLVSSVTGQISRNIEKVQAQLKHFTAKVEKTERYTAKLIKQTRDPDAFGAHREARRIRASAVRTQKEINALTRDVGQITIAQAKSVVSVAGEANMTVKELLSLNVELARGPLVPAGTVVNVYRSKAT
jgi:hypothetical protein